MSNFINADVKIDKFNEIIDIAKRTASDLKPAMAAIGNLVTKSVNSYRGSLWAEVKQKTKDFENALQSAAWEQAGYKGPNLLNQVRNGLYNFNLGLENADAATQAKLKNIYEDYAKKRVGLNKVLGFLKYEGMPGLLRFGENVASVNRIYGPLYGQMLRGFGIKQDNNEK